MIIAALICVLLFVCLVCAVSYRLIQKSGKRLNWLPVIKRAGLWSFYIFAGAATSFLVVASWGYLWGLLRLITDSGGPARMVAVGLANECHVSGMCDFASLYTGFAIGATIMCSVIALVIAHCFGPDEDCEKAEAKE